MVYVHSILLGELNKLSSCVTLLDRFYEITALQSSEPLPVIKGYTLRSLHSFPAKINPENIFRLTQSEERSIKKNE